MCTSSPGSQICPGLHLRQRGQQVEEEDSDPLLCSSETPPGTLHPAPAGPQHKNNVDLLKQVQRRAMKMTREMEDLSYEERLKELELFRWEEAAGRPYCGLPVPEEGLEER